jgi:hypothetical protein
VSPADVTARSHWTPSALLLIAAMALGSIGMWIGLPLALLYLASNIADSSQPSMGPYLLVLLGLPVGMFAIAKGLALLDRTYARVTGREDDPYQPAWMRSLRGERTSAHSRTTVLDVVMVLSVGAALLVGAIWFFLFAGSSLPGS